MGENEPPFSRAKVSWITYAAPTSGWARKIWLVKSVHFDLKNRLVMLVCLQIEFLIGIYFCAMSAGSAVWPLTRTRPTMRPQACMIIICVAFWVLHGWLIMSQRFLLAGVEIHEEMRDFLLFWRKRDRPTDRRTDGQTDRRTDPLIEMRGRI